MRRCFASAPVSMNGFLRGPTVDGANVAPPEIPKVLEITLV